LLLPKKTSNKKKKTKKNAASTKSHAPNSCFKRKRKNNT